jgi:hypothetical protein
MELDEEYATSFLIFVSQEVNLSCVRLMDDFFNASNIEFFIEINPHPI